MRLPAARSAPPLAPLLALLLVLPAPAAIAAAPPGARDTLAPVDPALLARVRDAARSSDWAWQHLAALTDTVGPRLAGSPQDAAAVALVADALRATGARVRLQAIKVPHWVRGAEAATVVAYPNQPPGIRLDLHLTALGDSAATPDEGLTAPVVVVRDFDDLKARAAEVRGNIVYFAGHFDQALADSGKASEAYAQAGRYRFTGPAAAARYGAAAVLLRSVGGASYRLPHTGVTLWNPGQAAVPAAALAAEDGDLLVRLAAQGPVRVHLLLTPRTLPDADGANVIADWPGREFPDEVVVVSGHLDSWDLGTGASDDGTGVIGAAAVIALLQQLDLHPRRTVRFVAWADEENGARGSKAYAQSVRAEAGAQVAAIESDSGAGHVMGAAAAVDRDTQDLLQPVAAALLPLGAGVLLREDTQMGADIAPLQAMGVPGFRPLVDNRHYFDIHHTAADTLDKVDPQNLRNLVATMAVLAFYLAELPRPLPRFTVAPAP